MKETFLILIQLNFFPKVPINKNSALVQKMARHQAGDKPLSEPTMAYFTDESEARCFPQIKQDSSFCGLCS